MKYINLKTKNVIETKAKITGANWKPVKEPKQKDIKKSEGE